MTGTQTPNADNSKTDRAIIMPRKVLLTLATAFGCDVVPPGVP